MLLRPGPEPHQGTPTDYALAIASAYMGMSARSRLVAFICRGCVGCGEPCNEEAGLFRIGLYLDNQHNISATLPIMTATPVYEEIRAQLRRLLASGRYKVGDQLPTIREFCEQYDINSVQTVRDAYQALKDEGLVTSRQGVGFFVAALPLRRLGLVGLAERAHQVRIDAERAAGLARTLETELTDALSDHERVAVDALTAAARATYLSGSGEERRRDFGEIALQVLAGAAANLGGVENLLAGRPGSWEADIIRNAVNAIAPGDVLPRYRTEPLRITLYVDQILAEHTLAHDQYDKAEVAIDDEYETANAALPQVDERPYVWVYEPSDGGDPVPTTPETPAWSWDAWRAGATALGLDEQNIATLEADIRGERSNRLATSVYVPKSPDLAAEFVRLLDEREAALAPYALQDALTALQEREWTEYGEALRNQIEDEAERVGLDVPVEVTIDTTGRPDIRPALDELAQSLVENAIAVVSSPADLPGTPLTRLRAER